MERAIARLRSAEGTSEWRDAVVESTAVLSRGVAGLLTTLKKPRAAGPRDVQALRFAKVKVAEMQLYRAEQVQSGQASRDLYGSLKSQIDEARAAYLAEFLRSGDDRLKPAAQIPDYLHQEMVRALAQNDEALLGPQYPGPLV